MALDPNRAYSAAEVQALLDRRELSQIHVDLKGVMQLAKETAEGLHELKGIVGRLVAADQQLGLDSMSPSERGALPGAVRAYLAGLASGKQRAQLWQRITIAAVAMSGVISTLSFLGIDSWVRAHILGLPP